MVAQRGLRRPLPAGGHVERPANAVENVDQPRRTRRPADPLARKPENLRECPRHQHVLGARGEFEAPIDLFGLEIFGIGMVEHQQHIAGQAGVQPRDLGAREIGPGGIVRIGEEHHSRALGHGSQQRVDVGTEIRIGRLDRGRAAAPRRNIVHCEAIAAEQHFIARPGEALRSKVQQFVRTGSADDPRGIDPVFAPQRGAQRRGVGIGIGGRGMIARQRRERLCAASQRVFVRRQLYQLAAVGTGGLARNIGMDACNPGFHGRGGGAGVVLSHFSFVA